MFRHRIICFLLALLCLLGLSGRASALEVDSGTVYCFSSADFSSESSLTGICILELPEELGAVRLGTRILQPGDILTADQVAQMTFAPLESKENQTAAVTYLPVFEDRVGESTAMTISIRGKEDKAPVAEDCSAETYKNLANTGKLKVTDPEGQALTYTVTRQPKRGTVTISEDGSFTYTPKKNKIGADSFTFTAADPAGNVSREATVTITILKPTDATQYTDTLGESCRFAAEWMRHTGIFTGERLAENPCFHPDRQVTRGEFITMLVKTLDIPTREEAVDTGYLDEIPQWLQPYLAAAMRSGLTAGLPNQEVFGTDEPITGAEVSVLLQNALDLSVPRETAGQADAAVPVWAQVSLAALKKNGFTLEAETVLTRGQAALLLYQAAQTANTVTE